MATKTNKVPERNDARNEQLITDYQAHRVDPLTNQKVYDFTISQLMAKHQISDTRIYELMDKNGVPRREKPQKRGKKGAKNGRRR